MVLVMSLVLRGTRAQFSERPFHVSGEQRPHHFVYATFSNYVFPYIFSPCSYRPFDMRPKSPGFFCFSITLYRGLYLMKISTTARYTRLCLFFRLAYAHSGTRAVRSIDDQRKPILRFRPDYLSTHISYPRYFLCLPQLYLNVSVASGRSSTESAHAQYCWTKSERTKRPSARAHERVSEHSHRLANSLGSDNRISPLSS